MNNNDFGSFLKMIREEEKMSIKDLAEKSGLSCVTISLLEKGKSNPNPITIAKISKALNCEYDLLAKYSNNN